MKMHSKTVTLSHSEYALMAARLEAWKQEAFGFLTGDYNAGEDELAKFEAEVEAKVIASHPELKPRRKKRKAARPKQPPEKCKLYTDGMHRGWARADRMCSCGYLWPEAPEEDEA